MAAPKRTSNDRPERRVYGKDSTLHIRGGVDPIDALTQIELTARAHNR